MKQERWFMGVLVVKSRVLDGAASAPLVDLQFRLIKATDAEAAYVRALELGKLKGHSYRNSEGAEVVWEFAGLHDLCELDDEVLSDGTEVYAQVVRDEPGNLVVSKERLTVFWSEANKRRTARELMEGK